MISCDALTKKFDHRSVAGVKNLTFKVKKGEVLAVLGPNGSGKSTLLNLIEGKIKPDGGSVKVEGSAVKFQPQWTENQNVQKFLLSSIDLPIPEEKKIQLTRDFASLFEFTFQLKQDLDSLSAGQTQKVLLAKTLINQPEIILFDEPFSHLDPFTRKEILDALFHYFRERSVTVLWVTHDLNEAMKYGDELLLLNHGVKEQLGTPKAFVSQPRNLFVAQFLGYKNFFPMKFVDGRWQTPFGFWEGNGEIFTEGYLLVPPAAFSVSADPAGLLVLGRHFENLQEILLVEDQQQVLKVEIPKALRNEPLTRVKLKPIWDKCLVIPL